MSKNPFDYIVFDLKFALRRFCAANGLNYDLMTFETLKHEEKRKGRMVFTLEARSVETEKHPDPNGRYVVVHFTTPPGLYALIKGMR